MAYSTHQTCPKCSEINDIFVQEAEIPSSDSWFKYHCPKCKLNVMCILKAYTTVVEMPERATVAERYVAPYMLSQGPDSQQK